MKTCWVMLAWYLLAAISCSRSNDLLFGRVQAKVGSHEIVVTDCYRTQVPQPSRRAGGHDWQPCRDAHIVIASEQLIVNGKSFGPLHSGDTVLVDHGVVSINPASHAN